MTDLELCHFPSAPRDQLLRVLLDTLEQEIVRDIVLDDGRELRPAQCLGREQQVHALAASLTRNLLNDVADTRHNPVLAYLACIPEELLTLIHDQKYPREFLMRICLILLKCAGLHLPH